jgi:hypothetical protein
MEGTVLIYRPDDDAPEVVEVTDKKKIGLEWLQAQVGGYIELVPGFRRFHFRGEERDCIAYCNECGKIDDLPFNTVATALWFVAVGRVFEDYLRGPVLILFGDREFMEAL